MYQVTFMGDATAMTAVDGFLKQSPHPAVSDLTAFFQTMLPTSWPNAASSLVAAGVSSNDVAAALDNVKGGLMTKIGGVATLMSAAASGYHGYRRNSSVWWGLWWFTSGVLFPIVTPVIGLAQGFAKRKGA